MSWLPWTSQTELGANLTSEGTQTISVSAVGPDGQTYTDDVTVTVISKEKLDNLLKKKWENMRTALANGDVTSATKLFSTNNRQLYFDIFTALQSQMPQLVQSMQNIQPISIQGGSAKFRIRKNQNYGGQNLTITHYIYFTQDENGLWKIERF
jgi:hypothetical protein